MLGKFKLDLEELSVDSFVPEAGVSYDGAVAFQSIYQETVLDHTEAYSCGGTCGTCGGTNCWA